MSDIGFLIRRDMDHVGLLSWLADIERCLAAAKHQECPYTTRLLDALAEALVHLMAEQTIKDSFVIEDWEGKSRFSVNLS